jgi:FKBP-type peptidyl-prolyl cis-trans isomerase 2
LLFLSIDFFSKSVCELEGSRKSRIIELKSKVKVEKMELKENDFVEIDYTGTIKDEGITFDTTDEKVAEEHNLKNEGVTFGPMIICLGKRQILKGIDKYLIGKDIGEYSFDIQPEDGYGKKNAKLIQMIPTNKFKKQGINPVPGLQVQLDQMVGTIRAVTGGRTMVDLNHPLSGRLLSYTVKVHRVVDDVKEQISSILKLFLGMEADIKINGDKAKLAFNKEFPEQLNGFISEKIKDFTNIKEVEIQSEKAAQKKTDATKDTKKKQEPAKKEVPKTD